MLYEGHIKTSFKTYCLERSYHAFFFFFSDFIYLCFTHLSPILLILKHENILFIYIYIYIYIYIFTGHFIRYSLLVPGWTLFCLQNCLNSSCHWFNKVLETFLRDFGPYWHDSITQLLQICRLHIHDVNLSFHHIPKMLYWIEIWWLWRSFE